MGLGLDDSEEDGDLSSVEGEASNEVDREEEGEEEEEEEDEGSGINEVQFGAYEQKLLNRFEKYLHSSDEEMHGEGEEQGEGQLTDKSWGRSKKAFYNTDFIDDEIGGEYCEMLPQSSLFLSCDPIGACSRQLHHVVFRVLYGRLCMILFVCASRLRKVCVFQVCRMRSWQRRRRQRRWLSNDRWQRRWRRVLTLHRRGRFVVLCSCCASKSGCRWEHRVTCVLCVLCVCVFTWMDGICMCVGCEGGQVPQRSKGVCVWGGVHACACVSFCVHACVHVSVYNVFVWYILCVCVCL